MKIIVTYITLYLHLMIDYQAYTLPNGIRILYKHAPFAITHCCFIVNAGSRDEGAQQGRPCSFY